VLLAAHGSTNVEVAGARAVVPLRFSGTGPAPCRGRTGLDGQAEVLLQERHRHADHAAEAVEPSSPFPWPCERRTTPALRCYDQMLAVRVCVYLSHHGPNGGCGRSL